MPFVLFRSGVPHCYSEVFNVFEKFLFFMLVVDTLYETPSVVTIQLSES
jgi:hypothetical protein